MNTETKVKEIWKFIEFTNGDFSVSNLGRVRNNGYFANHISGKRRVPPRIKMQGAHSSGYKSVSIYRKTYLVHRLIAEAFLDNPHNKEFVNHKDGVKDNNAVWNLEWCTRQENENHAFDMGLKNSTGSNNAMAKLDEEKVKEIKALSGLYGMLPKLVERYGVHRHTIVRVWQGKTWTHV